MIRGFDPEVVLESQQDHVGDESTWTSFQKRQMLRFLHKFYEQRACTLHIVASENG